jgi:hypothetical protein
MGLPRVSIFNCVSSAYEMLKFSTDAIIQNAGYDNYDYIVVTWGPTLEVTSYLDELKEKHNNVHIISYKTNKSVPYVPNLRGMMNLGFEYGFGLNDYCGLTNTDQYFGKDWLLNLVKYTKEEDIVSSFHISPTIGPQCYTADCGVTEYGKFNVEAFNLLYEKFYNDRIQTEEERGGGWRAMITMPYLFHKKFWKIAGPWELLLSGTNSPDVRFFERCKQSGAVFTMSHSSICYHHHAVERSSGRRPEDAKNMTQE